MIEQKKVYSNLITYNHCALGIKLLAKAFILNPKENTVKNVKHDYRESQVDYQCQQAIMMLIGIACLSVKRN